MLNISWRKFPFSFEREILIQVSCSLEYSFSILLQRIIFLEGLIEETARDLSNPKKWRNSGIPTKKHLDFPKKHSYLRIPIHHRVTERCPRSNGELPDIPD